MLPRAACAKVARARHRLEDVLRHLLEGQLGAEQGHVSPSLRASPNDAAEVDIKRNGLIQVANRKRKMENRCGLDRIGHAARLPGLMGGIAASSAGSASAA